jgi:hypothetical protein
MTTMKITLDAAMRARDVSPPGAVDDAPVGHSTVDNSTVGNIAGDDVPHTATRHAVGAQP